MRLGRGRSCSCSLSALSGLADYTDTDGTARTRATLHASLMVVALVILVVSLVMRARRPGDRTVPVVLSIVGFLIVTAGAFVGGDVVYRPRQHGQPARVPRGRHEVDRARPRRASPISPTCPRRRRPRCAPASTTSWSSASATPSTPCTRCAPTPAGRSTKGTVVDGCIECPWHGVALPPDRRPVVRGPSVYDQPAYEIRAAEGGGYEVRRGAVLTRRRRPSHHRRCDASRCPTPRSSS